MPKVRVRGIPYALEGSIESGQRGGIAAKLDRYRLPPNQWVEVSDNVAEHLRQLDARPQIRRTDWDTRPGTPDVREEYIEDGINNPHGQYILEFRDEPSKAEAKK